MVFNIGNNVWLGRKTQGDSVDDIPLCQNAVYIDIDEGIIYHYSNNAWNYASFGTKEDKLMVPILRQMTMTNIGTAYADIFPAFYDNFPIPFSTVGYKNFGIVLLWNKNGGTGRHDVRIVDNANTNEVLVNSENLDTGNGGDPTTGGVKSGRTKNYNVPLPIHFQDFRGEIRLQAKSTVAADDPIFDGLLIYLIR